MIKRKNIGSCAGAVVAATMLALPTSAAQPAPDFSKLSRAYPEQLRGGPASPFLGGPDQVTIQRKAGESTSSEIAPVTRLRTILAGCRKAAFTAAGNNGVWTISRQHFECLGPAAEDKSVLVTVTASTDGTSIASVTALLGGPIYWPPPPPRTNTQPTSDDIAEFEKVRQQAYDFLAVLARGEADAHGIDLVLWDEGKRIPISLTRAREILARCERTWAYREVVPVDGERRVGAEIEWKCDRRSSARADLNGFSTTKNGAVDHFYVSPFLGYEMPTSPGGQDDKH